VAHLDKLVHDRFDEIVDRGNRVPHLIADQPNEKERLFIRLEASQQTGCAPGRQSVFRRSFAVICKQIDKDLGLQGGVELLLFDCHMDETADDL
jgi:hypothetical protein